MKHAPLFQALVLMATTCKARSLGRRNASLRAHWYESLSVSDGVHAESGAGGGIHAAGNLAVQPYRHDDVRGAFQPKERFAELLSFTLTDSPLQNVASLLLLVYRNIRRFHSTSQMLE